MCMVADICLSYFSISDQNNLRPCPIALCILIILRQSSAPPLPSAAFDNAVVSFTRQTTWNLMLTQLWWLDLTLQQLPLISRTALAPRLEDAAVIFMKLFFCLCPWAGMVRTSRSLLFFLMESSKLCWGCYSAGGREAKC